MKRVIVQCGCCYVFRLGAQFSRSNRESPGGAPLSSGPNSAEGVTLVLSVEKGKKKKCSIPPGKDAGTVD